MRFSSRLAISLALLPVAVLAQDMGEEPPALRDSDHEFNEKVPSKFAGAMQSLKTAAGAEFPVYATGPEDSTKALLVIHEWWGLNAHIKGTADHFGKLGYRVLAVDLYGEVAKTPEQARTLMAAVKAPEATAKLDAALLSLSRKGRKIGTLGWCFGGAWSLRASLSKPELVAATCIYYGQLITEAAQLKTLNGPVLGIFAKDDPGIPPTKVAEFEAALKTAGVKAAIHSYDARHAFANPSGDRFQREAARDAWAKTLAFFKENLGE